MADAAPAVVYVDESGNTGENLKDNQDPVFTLAAVRLDDEHAAEIVQRVSAKLGKTGKELKSRTLLRPGKGQAVLLDELRSLPADCAFTLMVHKRFMIVGKLVDLLIVEAFDKVGYNMYADGSAMGLANLFYWCGPHAGDPHLWDELLDTFVDFAWGKDVAPPDRLFDAVDDYLNTVDEEWMQPFGTLRLIPEEAIRWWHARQLGHFDDNLDPAVTSLFAFCLKLGEKIGQLKIVHDEAAVIERHKSFLMNAGELPNLVHPGEKSPSLPITEIVFADSAASPQIQVADWIAAVTRRFGMAMTSPDAKKLPEEFADLAAAWLLWTSWPEPPPTE